MSRSDRTPELLTAEDKLEGVLDALQEVEPDFETAVKEAADAEAEYRIRFAEEFLKADGAAELRKQTATMACQKELRSRFEKEAVKDFLGTKVRDRQMAVSARQSLLSAQIRTNDRF